MPRCDCAPEGPKECLFGFCRFFNSFDGKKGIELISINCRFFCINLLEKNHFRDFPFTAARDLLSSNERWTVPPPRPLWCPTFINPPTLSYQSSFPFIFSKITDRIGWMKTFINHKSIYLSDFIVSVAKSEIKGNWAGVIRGRWGEGEAFLSTATPFVNRLVLSFLGLSMLIRNYPFKGISLRKSQQFWRHGT